MSIIIPANSAVGGGFSVDNSARFSRAGTDYLYKTFGTDGTSHKVGTLSIWFKRGILGAEAGLYAAGASGRHFIRIESGDTLTFRATTDSFHIQTTQVFRDPSAWSHIVIAFDTTQGTASNRVKFYHNGSQITSFSQTDYPDQNLDIKIMAAELNRIGRDSEQANPYWDGYMCEIVGIDGQQLTPTSFGEFDEDSAVWKPIDVSGLTFGTNGFYLNMASSTELGTDVSGNSNTFAEANLTAIDQTTDTCTNNFATMNPLSNYWTGVATFSEGNLKVATTNSGKAWNMSTIGLPAGKWYMEGKYVATGGNTPSDNWNRFGIVDREPTSNSDLGASANSYALTQYDGSKYVSGTNSTYAATWAVGDIIAMAIDLDNNKIYWSKNGAWATGSGAWGSATFNSGTGAVTVVDPTSTLNGEYFVAMGDAGVNTAKTWEFNFGNPTFTGTDKTDDNNRGSFEYTPPSGFLSICSSNLSEVLS
tara:strand:- start:1291 stop:2718 length:1428 start_codon:yes stop_codon:yes gene_type:complete